MTKRIGMGFAAIAVTAFVAASSQAADTIYRKSKTTPSRGEITNISRTEVTLKSKLKSKPDEKIPANDIIKVYWDGEKATLRIVRNEEDGGRLEKALTGYQKAFDAASATANNLRTDLQFLMARVTAKMALADPSKQDDAIKKLETFKKGNAANFRYYETLSLLGNVYLAKKDFVNAKATFAALKQAPWNDFKMAAQSAEARVKLLDGDLAGALASFNAVIAMPAKQPSELSRRYEAMLGKATCLQKQNQHAEATKVLASVIKQASPEDSAIQAEANVRQGDSLLATGKTKGALLAYLHVDVLFATEKSLHAESLYHVARLFASIGEPGPAADAAAKLESEYPNSEWAKRLTQAGSGTSEK